MPTALRDLIRSLPGGGWSACSSVGVLTTIQSSRSLMRSSDATELPLIPMMNQRDIFFFVFPAAAFFAFFGAAFLDLARPFVNRSLSVSQASTLRWYIAVM